MTSAEKLNTLLQENKGFLKTSDAVAAGVSRTVLGDFVRKYELERVAHGLYMSQDAWEDGLFVIQVRYPEAVFSHETALYLLNLANREPSPFSVTLKTGKNTAGLSNQGVRVYKVKDELFGEGIIEINSPSGHMVRAYNVERTICDLFRSRRNIEIQDLQAAIKDYIRLKDKNIPLLMRYAKAFSVEKIVRQYMEVLL
jgi:predicted transcriptional regulator of viral defense system